MLISIIVPFYNVEAYFRRCLESIINQSYQHLEIILINDCSPDNSIAIAREYAAKDRRIVIIEHEKSLHVGGARNTGLAAARGDYVWFIDSDDEIASPYAVEHLVHIAKEKQADVMLFDAIVIGLDGRYSLLNNGLNPINAPDYGLAHPFNKEVVASWLKQEQQIYFWPTVWDKLYSRDFLNRFNFRFLEHTIHQDEPTRVLLGFTQNIVRISHAYYRYYQRLGSSMNSQAPKDYEQHLMRVVGQILSLHEQTPSHLAYTQEAPLCYTLDLVKHRLRWVVAAFNKSQHKEVDALLLRWYESFIDFAQLREAFLRISQWSIPFEGQKRWREFFESYNRGLGDGQKILLMKQVLGLVTSKKPNLIKKMIKMLLPYGFIRLMQRQKQHKEVK